MWQTTWRTVCARIDHSQARHWCHFGATSGRDRAPAGCRHPPGCPLQRQQKLHDPCKKGGRKEHLMTQIPRTERFALILSPPERDWPALPGRDGRPGRGRRACAACCAWPSKDLPAEDSAAAIGWPAPAGRAAQAVAARLAAGLPTGATAQVMSMHHDLPGREGSRRRRLNRPSRVDPLLSA